MKRDFVGVVVCLAAILSPVSAQPAREEVNPKKAMAQAHTAMVAGRDTDALKLYEAIVVSQSRDAAKYKADALYGVAILRLSTNTSDPGRADAALNELTKSYPTSEHRYEAAALLRTLQQVNNLSRRADEADEAKRLSQEALTARTTEATGYRERIATLTSELDAARAQIDSGKSDTTKARREQTALLSETRTLRAEVAKLQAELEKKDQALRKIAGTIVK